MDKVRATGINIQLIIFFYVSGYLCLNAERMMQVMVAEYSECTQHSGCSVIVGLFSTLSLSSYLYMCLQALTRNHNLGMFDHEVMQKILAYHMCKACSLRPLYTIHPICSRQWLKAVHL